MAKCTVKMGDVEVTIEDEDMSGSECVDKATAIVKDLKSGSG